MRYVGPALVALLFLVIIDGSAVAANYQPVLEDSQGTGWSMVRGMLDGSPAVSAGTDISGERTIRTRYSPKPRWIVSGDPDSDGLDDAAVLFEDGSLRILTVDRGGIRTRNTIVNLSPESPPVAIGEEGSDAPSGFITVDDRNNLVFIGAGTSQTRTIAKGFSDLTYPVIADIDGDGGLEIVGVNQDGYMTVVFRRVTSRSDRTTELLPDARISIGDLNGDGNLEVVALSRPTDDLPLERLGDDLEARGVAVFTWGGRFLDLVDEFVLSDPSLVFEDLTPLIADVERGGGDEIILSQTGGGDGTVLRVLGLRSRKLISVRTGPGAGTGVYMQPYGYSDLGDSSRKFILTVSNPAADGNIELFKPELTATRLRLTSEISTLIAGTRTTELALVGDFNRDGEKEILAPSSRKGIISLFQLRKNRMWSQDLYAAGKTVSTNLCPGDFDGDGNLDVAVGFEDGTLVFIMGR